MNIWDRPSFDSVLRPHLIQSNSQDELVILPEEQFHLNYQVKSRQTKGKRSYYVCSRCSQAKIRGQHVCTAPKKSDKSEKGNSDGEFTRPPRDPSNSRAKRSLRKIFSYHLIC